MSLFLKGSSFLNAAQVFGAFSSSTRAVNSKEPTVIRSILMLYCSPSLTLYRGEVCFIALWIKLYPGKVHLETRAQRLTTLPSALAQLHTSQEEVGDSGKHHTQLEAYVHATGRIDQTSHKTRNSPSTTTTSTE